MFNLRYGWAGELWSAADLLSAGSAHWCSGGVQGCNTWHLLNHQTANYWTGLKISCLVLPSLLKWILVTQMDLDFSSDLVCGVKLVAPGDSKIQPTLKDLLDCSRHITVSNLSVSSHP